jgi:hypothetical protein
MLALLILAVLVVALAASDAPLGRQMRRELHDLLKRWLGRMSARRWAAFMLVSAVIAGVLVYLQSQGLPFLGPAAAEGIAALATIDVGTLIEAVAAAVLIAATVRLRWIVNRVSALAARGWAARRIGARGRARRTRRPPRRGGRNADDGPAPAFA